MDKLDAADISFPHSVMVTEQTIDTSILSLSQQNFYKKLFLELIGFYNDQKKARVVIGLAGPTGSGKSVIAALFQEFSKQVTLPFAFETLGIDAFHYYNEFLMSHKDTTGKKLKELKGRFDTYDVSKLMSVLEGFKQNKKVSLPAYSRKLHDPIENVHAVSEDKALLLVEGLWLLYDKCGWEKIALLLDLKIFVNADKEAVKKMVVQRHHKGGRSIENAQHYYDTVDAINFGLVSQTKKRADKVIASYYEVK